MSVTIGRSPQPESAVTIGPNVYDVLLSPTPQRSEEVEKVAVTFTAAVQPVNTPTNAVPFQVSGKLPVKHPQVPVPLDQVAVIVSG